MLILGTLIPCILGHAHSVHPWTCSSWARSSHLSLGTLILYILGHAHPRARSSRASLDMLILGTLIPCILIFRMLIPCILRHARAVYPWTCSFHASSGTLVSCTLILCILVLAAALWGSRGWAPATGSGIFPSLCALLTSTFVESIERSLLGAFKK